MVLCGAKGRGRCPTQVDEVFGCFVNADGWSGVGQVFGPSVLDSRSDRGQLVVGQQINTTPAEYTKTLFGFRNSICGTFV